MRYSELGAVQLIIPALITGGKITYEYISAKEQEQKQQNAAARQKLAQIEQQNRSRGESDGPDIKKALAYAGGAGLVLLALMH